MLNEHDLQLKEAIRQSRTPAQGARMNAGAATPTSQVSSTLQDADGTPRRLWIPGVDPWGVDGYYFGDSPLSEGELR
jgi:hypothetical protein